MPRNTLHKSLFAAIAIAMAGTAFASPTTAQSAPLFSNYDEASTLSVDTAPYSDMIGALATLERGRTLIAYDVANAQALPFFNQYVTYLAGIDVASLNRDEQLAYWLNTRNVLLIQALSNEERIGRFTSKRGTPQEPGTFWTEKRITVGGQSLSLQQIEEDILFAGWEDPNIVFGLYQGIEGGPALPSAPFTGSDVHAQLADAGRRFTSLPSNFRLRGSKVRISTYFDWYLPLAFDGNETALRQHLSSFASPDQKQLVSVDGELTRKKLSTSFERYRTRQAATGSGGFRSGGYGS